MRGAEILHPTAGLVHNLELHSTVHPMRPTRSLIDTFKSTLQGLNCLVLYCSNADAQRHS